VGALARDCRAAVTMLIILGAATLGPRVAGGVEPQAKSVRFGICADVHKDIMHDADERVRAFVERMNGEQVDFTIQLGDFCRPTPRNGAFLAIWRSFKGPSYHVLGNHDMDGGFTREQTVAYYKMPGRYYAFSHGGFRFIVLDGNDETDPPQSGYARNIGAEIISIQVFLFGHRKRGKRLQAFKGNVVIGLKSHCSPNRRGRVLPDCFNNFIAAMIAFFHSLPRGRLKRKIHICNLLRVSWRNKRHRYDKAHHELEGIGHRVYFLKDLKIDLR